MFRFTIFKVLQPYILHLNFARRKQEIALFAKFFTGEDSATELKCVQIMTHSFKERLSTLDVIGERAYLIKKFFEEIPIGQKFLNIKGHLDDELEYQRYLSILAQINGLSFDTSVMDHFGNYLRNHYEVRIFKGDDRRRIGENDKTKRVCRFCGRRIPAVSFNHKSHAISESLGNKTLICLEECDECNKHFNESLEQDITQMMAPRLLLLGISGKKGVPIIKGDGITIKIDTSTRAALGRDTLVYTLQDMPDILDPELLAKHISKDYKLYLKYTPQNIYKCLCKYALSLIDSSELQYFKDTIAWINEPLTKHRLPPVWRYHIDTEGQSWDRITAMIIMKRKHAKKELPYCWAILIIAGEPFLFILPFCSQDKFKFIGKERQEFFINGIKNMMNGIQLFPTNFSRTTVVKTMFHPSFVFSPDAKEG